MNVAIVIAVSNYHNTRNNLPASKKDGVIINGILQATRKYDKILYINNDEDSFETKQLLSNFFAGLKGVIVDELFFYYSGHGEFSNDGFYFPLSDFDNKKRNRTSLQNAEVDDLIRNISPALVVKIIDACQSGTSYIKENDVVTNYFNETKKGFNKCYFLNSSLNNQSSYQDDKLSFFTASFVSALKEHPTSEIRYRDIIDFILDDFQGNEEQVPFFVIQADLTEKFCTSNEDFKSILEGDGLLTTSSESREKLKPTLTELVIQNAKDYVDEDGAIEIIDFVKEKISELKLDKEFSALFELTTSFTEENNSIPGSHNIGTWLKNNSHDFFAFPIESEEYDDNGNYYEYISGYSLSINSTYKAITIEIQGKYPNLKSYQYNIAFLVSKRNLSFFYSILPYVEQGWSTKVLELGKVKWTYTTVKIGDRDDVLKGIKSVSAHLNERIKLDISSQFGIKDDSEDDDLPF